MPDSPARLVLPPESNHPQFAVAGSSPRMRLHEDIVVPWTIRMCEIGFEHDAAFDGWETSADPSGAS